MPVIQANGVGFYYEWHGADGAPVLVLNNGILMNAAASWVPQTAAFSASCRVLQYDCRGQGQSDHPAGPYSMEQHADDLAALLEALGVRRAHVLGISYGGEVSQAFAFHHAIRGSRIHVLGGAGHAASWEAAAEFNRVVLRFLAAQPGV